MKPILLVLLPIVFVSRIAADPILLTHASYVDKVNTPTGAITFSASAPDSREMVTPVALSTFTTGPGTASGSYGLFAGTNRDTVQGTVMLEGNSLLDSAKFYINVMANTNYQVVVRVKRGKSVPGNIKSVPIIASAKGSVSCSPTTQGSTEGGGFGQAVVTVVGFATYSATCGKGPRSFLKSTVDDFTINKPVNVQKQVSGGLAEQVHLGTITENFSITADPTFEIDPGFAFADDFELVFSPGAEPVSNTPEPASVAMLGLGMVLLGVHCRLGKAGKTHHA
jgi:hypothetical protein